MTAVEPLLKQAQEVIDLGNGLISNQSESEGTALMAGHKVVHWSHYVLLGTTIVGLITSIAAAILTQWPLCIACVVLTASSGLGAYYIKELSITDAFADVIKKMITTIQELYKGVQGLYQQIEDLTAEKDGLKNAVKTYGDTINKGKEELEEEAKKLQEVTKQLVASEAKVEDLQKVVDPLQKTVTSFITASDQLLNDVNSLGISETKLNDALKDISKINAAEGDLKNDLGNFTLQNKLAAEYISKLSQIIEFFKKAYPELKKQKEDLLKELDVLKTAQVSEAQTVAQVTQTEKDYESKIIPFLQELMTKLPLELMQELNQKLESLKTSKVAQGKL